jgi:uncharacterized protein YeeX (DUF496 family)
MKKHTIELRSTLLRIHKDLQEINNADFDTKIGNINNRISFLKNFSEIIKEETGSEAFIHIKKELMPVTKLINDSFDNVINRITIESNSLMSEITKIENKKKINSYRSYNEY